MSNGAGRVAGKVALITGGGTGIGRAIAVSLVQKGADVVVISRTPEHVEETCDRAEEASGRRPLSFPLDVSARAAVDRVVGQVADRFGRIDVLSNNAGIELPHGPSVAETTDEEWEQLFRVNVTGRVLRLPGGSCVHAGRRLDREHGVHQLLRRLGERRRLHGDQGGAPPVHAGRSPSRSPPAGSAPTASALASSTRR